MPKHVVTAIGLIVSLGVIALGVSLVALPLYFQSLGVAGQTATVTQTNAIYQAQVDGLRAEEENLDEINAQVESLRVQIPETGELDDVFEIVGNAAVEAGVTLTNVTAGEQVVFAVRTGPEDDAAAAPAPDAGAEGEDTADAGDATAGGTTAEPTAPTPATEGRQQVDFTIAATAPDMAAATAFLDALRSGPRLLNLVQVITLPGEGDVSVQITALTYIDAEG